MSAPADPLVAILKFSASLPGMHPETVALIKEAERIQGFEEPKSRARALRILGEQIAHALRRNPSPVALRPLPPIRSILPTHNPTHQ